jgi:hypothetical protein
MRKTLCLLVVVLAVLAVEMLPPQNLLAVACTNAPNTPLQVGTGASCDGAAGSANGLAYTYATNYCTARCGHVCLFSFNAYPANYCSGPLSGVYRATGYGTFGCAQTTYPCPTP